MPDAPNLLYYGDNLDVLRRHVDAESVDLVYLDPPFKSNQDYNVLFREHDKAKSAAQIKVFEDTWEWDEGAALAFEQTIEAGGRVADALRAFRTFLGESDMLAYLSMMAPRLMELRRVMKATASIYLHCDPTASHYLKMLMDAVFGPANFRNEIIWKRKAGRGETNNQAVRFGVSTDSLLFFVKSGEAKFHRQYRPSNPDYIATKFTHTDEHGRRYRLDNLTSPSYRRNLIYEYKGYPPPEKGWAVSRERMAEMEREGRLYFPKDKTHRIQRLRFLDELPGETVDTLWDDIPPINSQAAERLGYPTQKPENLLERIIGASSDEGDVVLDPFCGCGTAIASAQKLKRQWIGIDITHLAIALIKHRLTGHDDEYGKVEYRVVGEPTDAAGAEALAASDPYQFQWWSLGLVGARPTEQKKGADRGVDGRLYFHDEERGGTTKQIVFSVKAGHTGPTHVRDLGQVVTREKAQLGVLITMQEPTQPMRKEAASAGFYDSPVGKHQRLQIFTVADLLDGKVIDYPSRVQRVDATFKKAPKARKEGEQHRLL